MFLCSVAAAGAVFGAVALARGLFFRRHFGGGGCGGGHHGEGRHGFRGRGWSRGPGFFLRGIFSRLDTTPGQEREIREAVEEFRKVTKEARSEVEVARQDVARAVSSEAFDEIAMGEAQVKVTDTTSRVREAFEAMLKRVHAVLDSSQRERFGRLFAAGFGSMRGFGGPYRG